MACESMIQPGQTAVERKAEVKKAMTQVDKLIAARKVQVVVGAQGAITFTGIPAAERKGMVDSCIYNKLSRTGSAATKLAIARAEQAAGVRVNRAVVNSGVHSHDGGATWSTH